MSPLKQRPCLVRGGKEEYLSPEKQKIKPTLATVSIHPCVSCMRPLHSKSLSTVALRMLPREASYASSFSSASCLLKLLPKLFSHGGGSETAALLVGKGCLAPTTAQLASPWRTSNTNKTDPEGWLCQPLVCPLM